MIPAIQKASSPKASDSIIILAINMDDISQLNVLSKDELKYAGEQYKKDKKTLIINQYSRHVVVQFNPGNKSKHLNLEKIRQSGDASQTLLNKAGHKSVSIISHGYEPDETVAFTEGMVLGSYQFVKYHTGDKAKPNSLGQIRILDKRISKRDIELISILSEAVYKARDLVNEPLSYLTAVRLAEEFQSMAKDSGARVQIWNRKKIESMKMGGLLAVNKGSIDPPTYTIIEWKPAKPVNKKPVVLVGKGVVYDTGGLSLKPTPNSMDYMKCDMGGAASVGCAIHAIAKARLPVHVVALIPATDNRPDGNAYVPGDVVNMMGGQTVEVLNTDAEGRMILADALTHAKSYKPSLVMDFATLTGAAAAAIGQFGIVCMGTASTEEKQKLMMAGDNVYERLAEFPLWDEYDDLIKSDIADMKNVGGPYGGAITAGKFLQRFVDYPWMHFDIAGPAFLKSGDSYRGKNGSGVGVRLIFEYIKLMSV
jgi:leucyl aminopeptidase